jgi:peptide deformylase
MIHNIDTTNQLLKNKALTFDFSNPSEDPLKIAVDITESLLSTTGIGLAANQLGWPYRCLVVRTNPIVVMFNPRIVDTSVKEVYMEEGCLSFPGLIVNIKRSESIKVRFELPNGETVTNKYTGLTARTIQHEIDHLDGIIFYERATRYHRDKAFKKLAKKGI